MSSVFNSISDFLGRASLPVECPEDPELGAWFLSPQQHLMEFFVTNAAFLYLAYLAYHMYTSSPSHSLLTHRVKAPTRQGQQRLHSFSSSIPTPLLSHLQVFLLALSYSLLFIHKWREDRLWFLLQPCHVLHLLLMYITTLPPSTPRAIFLFNLYLHLLFSPLLGLVAADLSCYTQHLELFNWGLQHVLLLLIPLFSLWPPSRYPLLTGLPFFLLCFSIEVLFHSAVLTPAALWTGYNLNYVLCPPVGVLSAMGPWYRLVMTGICAVLSVVVRYGMVEGWRWVVEKGVGGGVEGPDVVKMELKDKGEGRGKQLVMNEEKKAGGQEGGGIERGGEGVVDGVDQDGVDEHKEKVTQRRRTRKG